MLGIASKKNELPAKPGDAPSIYIYYAYLKRYADQFVVSNLHQSNEEKVKDDQNENLAEMAKIPFQFIPLEVEAKKRLF